jgi:hypothetical protein
MVRANAMDSAQEGSEGRAAAAPPDGADAEAERARRYLDLWERHVAFLAAAGPAPPARVRAGPTRHNKA